MVFYNRIIFFISTLIFISCSINNRYDLVITNVKLFDGEEIYYPANVFIKEGIIQKITVDVKKENIYSKELIDGTNKTLLPGLINAHVHASKKVNLQEAAASGVLTLLDLFNPHEDSIKFLKNLKDSDCAYYYSSGICITSPEGHGTEYDFIIPTVSNPEEARMTVEERVKNGADYIKIIFEHRMPTLSDSSFKVAIETAHSFKKLAVVHIGSLNEAVMAFDYNADVIAHLWTDTTISDSLITHFKKRPFYIIPTLTVIKRFLDLHPNHSNIIAFPQILKQVEMLHKSGITILVGTDSPNFAINFGEDLYEELEYLVESGFSQKEAIQAATVNASKAFNLKEKGFIKIGGSADFVLINGDVLQDITVLRNKKMVWKQGVLLKI